MKLGEATEKFSTIEASSFLGLATGRRLIQHRDCHEQKVELTYFSPKKGFKNMTEKTG
ncbi:hypothetical protein [Neisseria gonorrhoeae]|uniref:hypothetical protein n=1 Tax=Neisseria gonorrhoeae TaxID=485 RepID=UPI0030C85798